MEARAPAGPRRDERRHSDHRGPPAFYGRLGRTRGIRSGRWKTAVAPAHHAASEQWPVDVGARWQAVSDRRRGRYALRADVGRQALNPRNVRLRTIGHRTSCRSCRKRLYFYERQPKREVTWMPTEPNLTQRTGKAGGEVDLFLKVTGTKQGVIKGESQDHKHKDEIDIQSFQWGVAQ